MSLIHKSISESEKATYFPCSVVNRQLPYYLSKYTLTMVVHRIYCLIKNTIPATFQRYRCLDQVMRHIAQKEFERMMELRVTRPSNSIWSSALHMVQETRPGS